MRQPTIHQMREKKIIEKSQGSRKVTVPTTFLHIIIILHYVINSKVRCRIWRDVGPTQKNEIYSRDFFVSANIIQQVVDF
jgi:hypothetical protein